MADRIEKKIVLKAPLARVWKAISDAKQFGAWFGVAFDGPFVAGQPLKGRIVPTKVDPAVAAQQEPYVGMACDIVVDRIEPERLFSFRWHPGVPDEGVELSDREMTLVTFELEAVDGGTLLRVTESDFDKVPLARRAKAFTGNEGGWEAQTELVKKFVEGQHASE